MSAPNGSAVTALMNLVVKGVARREAKEYGPSAGLSLDMAFGVYFVRSPLQKDVLQILITGFISVFL